MRMILKALGVVGLLTGLFVVGYSWRDLSQRRLPTAETLSSILPLSPPKPKLDPAKVFRQTYNHIQTSFARKVDPTELKYAGLGGLVASLGDPHTMFMEPQLRDEFMLETRAQFAGIGARLAPDPLGARIAIVFEEAPAGKAGLKAGDLVTAVDGKNVGGQEVDDIVSKIRGPEGTWVQLTVARSGEAKPLSFRIQRAKIITPTVTSKVLPNTKIGYINITNFAEPTAEQFEKAWVKLDGSAINGLIIDLRGNPGGLLETARDILSLFVENKPVVTMRGRGSLEEQVSTLVGRKRAITYPVVTLVNEESASAAEIMAGVLKDYKLTTLVGEHTYGKASVQNMFPLIDGSAAKVTIARYYLPSGDDISRKVDDDGMYVSGGIKVDVEVKLQDEPSPVIGDPKFDSQLKKAIEVVVGKVGASALIFPPKEPEPSFARSPLTA